MTRIALPSIARGLAAAAMASALGGCAAVVVGGAVGAALMVTDRRTSGTVLEDQAIELKAMNRVRDAIGDRGHVVWTSYNRTLLLTGEVPNDADRAGAERAVAGIDNLKGVVNELAVMASSSLTERSNDSIVTGRVKARFIDAKDLQANAVKVVTERGNVYLLGRVTEREANRATELARGVSGVLKVVRVFEVLSEAELAAMEPGRR